jgi:hypothetical protein
MPYDELIEWLRELAQINDAEAELCPFTEAIDQLEWQRGGLESARRYLLARSYRHVDDAIECIGRALNGRGDELLKGGDDE